MKLTFRIAYRTAWGEEAGVTLDGGRPDVIKLRTTDGEHWEGTADVPGLPAGTVTYRYGIYRDGQCVRRESGNPAHAFCPDGRSGRHYLLNDAWRDLPAVSYQYSAAFSGSYRKEGPIRRAGHPEGSITFRALCPCLRHRKQVLGISGDCAALGRWEAARAVKMEEIQPNEWAVTLDAAALSFPLAYKYVACSRTGGQVEEWEMHDNRRLSPLRVERGEAFLMPEAEVRFASFDRKVAGTAIPVFSLRSEESFGVGDFGDLRKLIDWAAETRQQAVQILPINDTTLTRTWMDSYPYNGISIYALHPMYLDLRQLGPMKDQEQRRRFAEMQKALNAYPTVHYEEVNAANRAYAETMFAQDGARTLASAGFRKFFEANRHWLLPYAAFS